MAESKLEMLSGVPTRPFSPLGFAWAQGSSPAACLEARGSNSFGATVFVAFNGAVPALSSGSELLETK